MNTSLRYLRRSFSEWKPHVPKHRIVIDKQSHRMAHPVWSLKDAETVEINHHKPSGFKDYFAYGVIRACRVGFDACTGYKSAQMSESQYLRRFIFLETIAGVPGMMAAMIRHMKALRTMQHDGGWIHHLLEEAENERMHLFTFIQMRNPGIIFRLTVMAAQAVFIPVYGSLYVLSPSTAHRLVGYLEEEAVKTYTKAIKELDEGTLPQWVNLKAAENSIKYWGLSESKSNLRDVLLAIRADEVMHREVNHHLADLNHDAPLENHSYFVVENMVGAAFQDEQKVTKK